MRKHPLNNLLTRRIKMNNKQLTVDHLHKHLKVLNNVKPDQKVGWIERYRAACPNHEAHATKGANNEKLVIGVMPSKNIDKFGKYCVSYYCNAHGADGLCGNNVLADIFSKRFNLGTGSRDKEITVDPSVFPKADESYKLIKGYQGSKAKFFDYHGWTEDDKYFSRAMVIQPSGKEYFPICYSTIPDHFSNPDLKGEGTWIGKMLWEPPYPPFRMYKATKHWQQINNKNYSYAVIHEGEAKSLVAQELIPDAWHTSLYCQVTKWQQAYFDVFTKVFDYVVIVPDNDVSGRKTSKELALYMQSLGINTRLVDIPRDLDLPDTWDIKDGFEGTKATLSDWKQWIKDAKVPQKREDKTDYSNLEEDASLNRWVHLRTDRHFHYDKFTREIMHNDNINLYYQNDIKTRDLKNKPVTVATKYLHQVGCEKCEGLAYRPIDQEYIYEGKRKYVNSYIAYKPKELTEDEYDEKIIEPFHLQCKILSNFDQKSVDFFYDKLATILQRPDINIQHATLIISNEEGTGKTSLWRCISEINGGSDYVAWIRSRDVFHQFRSWMADKSLVIVNEVRIEGNEREKNKLVDNLKELITDEEHTVEKKNINPFQVKNEYTVFMSSNHDTLGLVKKKDARRYFVWDCLMEREEINEQFPNHFSEFRALSKDKEKLRHLRYFFKYKWQISEHYIKKGHFEPYITNAKEQMAEANESQLTKNLKELLENKSKPFEKDIVRVREVYQYLKSFDRDHGTRDWGEADEDTIRKYFQDIGKSLNNGDGIECIRKNEKKKRGWFAIRNAKFWSKQKPLQYRLHLNGELEAPEFPNQIQEGLFNEEHKEINNETGADERL